MTVGARNDNWEVWDQTGSATRLAITTGGNVGIGTTNPGHLLAVNGTANIVGALTVGGNVSVNSGSIILYGDGDALFAGTSANMSWDKE